MSLEVWHDARIAARLNPFLAQALEAQDENVRAHLADAEVVHDAEVIDGLLHFTMGYRCACHGTSMLVTVDARNAGVFLDDPDDPTTWRYEPDPLLDDDLPSVRAWWEYVEPED